MEQQLGADHPAVAISLNNLAGLYRAMGRYGEAEPLYGRSLTIREQQLGADHPDVASSLNNLAALYEAMGRYGEAEPLYLLSLGKLTRFPTIPLPGSVATVSGGRGRALDSVDGALPVRELPLNLSLGGKQLSDAIAYVFRMWERCIATLPHPKMS